MKLVTNVPLFENDLYEIVRLFSNDSNEDFEINIYAEKLQNKYECKIIINNQVENAKFYSIDRNENQSELLDKRYFKRHIKNCLYIFLSSFFGVTFPWGSLTGVRPTRLFYEFVEHGNSLMNSEVKMMQEYKVDKNKAHLTCEVVSNQKGIIKNDKLVNFYVNIPFCPSRCSYCSFISSDISFCRIMIPEYIDCLIKEIREVKSFLFENSYIVKSIYVGGGTPTSLEVYQLDMILSELKFNVNEFTVECGRPDTIDAEKLDILQKHGVTRISINPQTFSDRTLKLIGRRHTTEQTLKAYALALNYNFSINMDLIAGLPSEQFPRFKKNVDTAVELAPQNITIHTLSIKNGSYLAGSDMKYVDAKQIEKMVDYSYKKLLKAGYKPYYMYRQKNMLGYFENVGYSLPNETCKFNIESMEEMSSIVAVGAGAISKRVYLNSDRIERSANVKQVYDYIHRLDEMIQRKIELFR